MFSKIKIVALTTGFLALSITPAFASTGITTTIKNNGSKSINGAMTVVASSSKLTQKNMTSTNTGVFVANSSGSNKISNTTGGSTSITTGGLTTHVTINTASGSNAAEVNPCGCPNPEVNTTIEGNGSKSMNMVGTLVMSSNSTSQTNLTSTNTMVMVSSSSGGNTIKGTTQGGEGDPSVTTGAANTDVTVNTISGSNVLTP